MSCFLHTEPQSNTEGVVQSIVSFTHYNLAQDLMKHRSPFKVHTAACLCDANWLPFTALRLHSSACLTS